MKIYYLIVCILVFSCKNTIDTAKKVQHEFVYEFEQELDVANIDTAISVIKKRLNTFKYDYEIKHQNQKSIKVLVKTDELDHDRFHKIISNQGKLEFWEMYETDALKNNILKIKDTLINTTPLVNLIAQKAYNNGGSALFYAKEKDTIQVNEYLNSEKYKTHLLSNYSHVNFLWGIQDDEGLFPLYGVKSNAKDKAPLTGEAIVKVDVLIDISPAIGMEMNEYGALMLEDITENAYNNTTGIAITINNVVYSAPRVVSGAIKGGKVSVSGNFTLEEAEDLAIVLSSQKELPKLKLVSYNILK